MTKTKRMGTLAITAMVALGTAGLTNAFAEERPATKPTQQPIASTTDDGQGVMSYQDKATGRNFVSEDDGVTWVSQKEYDNSYPAIQYEWWTYEEYNQWLEETKKNLQAMADDHTMVETSQGTFLWTQEMTDQYIAEYEQTLKDVQNSLLVSKSVDGDTQCMTTFNQSWVNTTTD